MKKRILIVAAVIILLLGGCFLVKVYPLYHAYRSISDADCIYFSGDYHLKDASVLDNNEFLYELLQDGKFEGEYTQGICHVLLYSEDYEKAVLEIYYGEDRKIINIGQILDFGIDYIIKEKGIPIGNLFDFDGVSADYYATPEQLQQITGKEYVPSVDDDEKEKMNTALKAMCLKLLNRVEIHDNEYSLSVSDEEEIPLDFSITLTIPDGDHEMIQIPESSMDDRDVEIYRSIYEMIQRFSK